VVVIAGKVRNMATKTKARAFVDWEWNGASEKQELDSSTHALAAQTIISIPADKGVTVDAVGHGFVHGGPSSPRRHLSTTRRCRPCGGLRL